MRAATHSGVTPQMRPTPQAPHEEIYGFEYVAGDPVTIDVFAELEASGPVERGHQTAVSRTLQYFATSRSSGEACEASVEFDVLIDGEPFEPEVTWASLSKTSAGTVLRYTL